MKMLIVGLAVATLLAAPASAQSYDPDIGTGNIAPPMNLAPSIDDPASAWGSISAVTSAPLVSCPAA
jgi:hypothetical protein